MNINLEQIVEKLGKISNDDITNETIGWEIPENRFSQAMMLNGTVKRFKKINSPDNLKILIIHSQVIFLGYVTFVFMQSDLIASKLASLKNSSKLFIFKQIFARPVKGKNISDDNITGLHCLIRNSIGHGSFNFEDGGKVTFTDTVRNISITVDTYNFINLCVQIERFYMQASVIERS